MWVPKSIMSDRRLSYMECEFIGALIKIAYDRKLNPHDSIGCTNKEMAVMLNIEEINVASLRDHLISLKVISLTVGTKGVCSKYQILNF